MDQSIDALVDRLISGPVGQTRGISGPRSRPSGPWFRSSGTGAGPGSEPVPDNPYLRPEGRDLRPEDASHVCTFAQAVGRFALLHLGQHVLPPLPFPFSAICEDIG